MNLQEELDKAIKAISPYHYKQPAYYCTQEHYDLLKENNLLYLLNEYKIVIVPAFKYWSKYED